jgi:hypothetical protein
MMNPLHLINFPITEEVARNPKHCATPGCRRGVNENWDETGLLCPDCVIEGALYDRDARWDNVSQIPGTRCLPS